MPELPEVETVRAGLAPELEGKRIARLELRRKNLRHPFPADLVKKTEGARILRLRRRAKYLLVDLDNGHSLLIHLGMSGKMLLHKAKPNAYDTHDHVVMTLTDGETLIFNDARRFGLWLVVETAKADQHPLLAHLGPEPLEADFDAAYLQSALSRRAGPIKPALMDQKLVVGVGNIYASEALFCAHIHPETPANKIKSNEFKIIVNCIQSVLQAAIASGGSTLRDFVRSSGDIGYFQHHFAVYGRAGLPCPRCTTLIEQKTQAGRSTFFCPKCQPKKRRAAGRKKAEKLSTHKGM